MTFAIITSCAPKNRMLVLFYSQEGATKEVAGQISNQTGADIVSFDVEDPYTGSFDETVARCLEEKSAGKVPDLKPLDIDLDDYEIIFLGYPIWFGTYAPPVMALLNEIDFSGKKIVPFCTFGSGGLQASVADLKKAVKGAEILDGYGIRAARIASAPAEIERFLIESGFKKGEVEALPDYSEQKPVTEEEADIFNEACAGYQFPLGTPVSAGCRLTSTSKDYLFIAESESSDGSMAQSRIFVTVPESGKAEFTQVIR